MLQAKGENLRRYLKGLIVGRALGEIIVAVFHYSVPSVAHGRGNDPKRREIQDAQITDGSEDSSAHFDPQ